MRRTPAEPERRAPSPRSVIVPPRREPGGAPRWLRRGAFGVALLALVAAVPLLARVGWRHAIAANSEAAAASAADVNAPGYRAVVSPTPTLLVVHRSPEGRLAGVSMLARTGDDSGAVLLIPTSLVVDGGSGRARTLASVFAAGGVDEVGAAVARALHLGFDRVVALDAADWASAAGATVVVVDNPDELSGPDGEVRFETGRLTLRAEDIEPYLRLRKASEEDRGRLFRNDLLWTAWMKALAKAPADPTADPFTTMLHNLAKGTVEVVELPVMPADVTMSAKVETGVAATAGSGQGVGGVGERETYYVVDADLMTALVSMIVPFPSAARPGDRVRVRLLDGVGDQAAALSVSAKLVPAGAEITVFGNANRFDYANTTVEFFDEAQRNHATTMAAALGVTSAVFNPTGDATVDVSVIVGRDLAGPGVDPKVVAPATTTGR